MNPLNVSFLQEIMATVAEQGRAFLPSSLFGADAGGTLERLVDALISGRGEASGVAIAQEILGHYEGLEAAEKEAFFRDLASRLQPDAAGITAAAEAYLEETGEAALMRLQAAVESPRQEFFRRLNLAPGATGALVAMRRDLLNIMGGATKAGSKTADLTLVDRDLRLLFQSWFNRGFLILRRIDWQTPAAILEKIIAYEAVHEIRGWEDLRRRLDPVDRRCFAFFHPSLVDEPLIFVEVALVNDIATAIRPVLDQPAGEKDARDPSTAVFYSISNCQEGLKGISFGSFLIKQVVDELAKEIPSLKVFVTLSPVPGFAKWLTRVKDDPTSNILTADDRAALKQVTDGSWPGDDDGDGDDRVRASLMALAAEYFFRAKTSNGKPVDPVARFHLGNGARLEQINWRGDLSEKGLREAHGLMVNYRYDPKEIETNHEAFANEGTVAASRSVRGLLRGTSRGAASGGETSLPLLLPGARADRLPSDEETS